MSADTLEQAQCDLALVQQQLTAIGVILASICFAMADAQKTQAKRAKATRKATRRAMKPSGRLR